MSDVEKRLTECRERIDRLQARLQTRLDAGDVSLRAQLPFYALYYRETLTWRMPGRHAAVFQGPRRLARYSAQ